MSDLAEGCVCGRCNPACKFRMCYSCCGACMVDSPFAGTETPTEVWNDYMARHPEDFPVTQ